MSLQRLVLIHSCVGMKKFLDDIKKEAPTFENPEKDAPWKNGHNEEAEPKNGEKLTAFAKAYKAGGMKFDKKLCDMKDEKSGKTYGELSKVDCATLGGGEGAPGKTEGADGKTEGADGKTDGADSGETGGADSMDPTKVDTELPEVPAAPVPEEGDQPDVTTEGAVKDPTKEAKKDAKKDAKKSSATSSMMTLLLLW